MAKRRAYYAVYFGKHNGPPHSSYGVIECRSLQDFIIAVRDAMAAYCIINHKFTNASIRQLWKNISKKDNLYNFRINIDECWLQFSALDADEFTRRRKLYDS